MELETAASIYANVAYARPPLWVIVLILAVVLPLSAVAGHYNGTAYRRRRMAEGKDIDLVAGETTLGAILALLGLLLGFTFANALSLSQARKSVLYEESAALGTAFLRADYLAEPGRTDLQKALYEYAQTRFVPRRSELPPTMREVDVIEISLRAQAAIWPATLAATGGDTPDPIRTFVAGAVNEVLDAHLDRMATVSHPVSLFTHAMLLASAATALFLLGNRAGALGRDLTWQTFVLSAFLFAVMATIVDTQRASQGLIVLEETALRATLFEMEAALAGRL